MFMDEARLSLRLNHPNVVQTYEVLDGGGRAVDRDGVPGRSAADAGAEPPPARAGELSLPLRLRILMSVLAGLEHAHTLQDLDGTPLEVVHRDVSPQNVFVTYDGQVKLVDFGVAKTLAASHHTRPGTLKGKLAYMAPEQLQRVEIDRRADLFAVGVMLWEMLAGRRMWYRMTEVEIVSHLAAGQPLPPLPADAGRPPGLDAICARGAASDPNGRYDTAAEMEMDLESVLDRRRRFARAHLARSFRTRRERARRAPGADRAVGAPERAGAVDCLPPAPTPLRRFGPPTLRRSTSICRGWLSGPIVESPVAPQVTPQIALQSSAASGAAAAAPAPAVSGAGLAARVGGDPGPGRGGGRQPGRGRLAYGPANGAARVPRRGATRARAGGGAGPHPHRR